MKEKKTEVMTIRITPCTKKTIEQEAARREWSTSKMAEKILAAWAAQHAEEDKNEMNIDIHENTIQNINIMN